MCTPPLSKRTVSRASPLEPASTMPSPRLGWLSLSPIWKVAVLVCHSRRTAVPRHCAWIFVALWSLLLNEGERLNIGVSDCWMDGTNLFVMRTLRFGGTNDCHRTLVGNFGTSICQGCHTGLQTLMRTQTYNSARDINLLATLAAFLDTMVHDNQSLHNANHLCKYVVFSALTFLIALRSPVSKVWGCSG